MGGRDKDEDERRFILRVLDSKTTDAYEIHASYQRTKSTPVPKAPLWSFEITLTVAQEGAAQGPPIPIRDVEVTTPECTFLRQSENQFLISAPKAVDKVVFQVTTDSQPLGMVDLREVWPALTAKTKDNK